MFTDKEKVIGVVDVGSGGIMITDAVWASAIPATTDSHMTLDLRLPVGKIPIISVMKGGKRFLIIDLDNMWRNTNMSEAVTVENPVQEVPAEGESEEW
jgi:hypothetical protein